MLHAALPGLLRYERQVGAAVVPGGAGGASELGGGADDGAVSDYPPEGANRVDGRVASSLTDEGFSPQKVRKMFVSHRYQPTPANGVYAGQKVLLAISCLRESRLTRSASTSDLRRLR